MATSETKVDLIGEITFGYVKRPHSASFTGNFLFSSRFWALNAAVTIWLMREGALLSSGLSELIRSPRFSLFHLYLIESNM